MQKQKFIPTHSLEYGCADCEYMAFETEGEITICTECEIELAEYDEHQPDELTEWMDFDPDC